MVRMIMELVRNRSFTLTTGDSKQSRLRHPKNSVPQGSVLAPLFFQHLYIRPTLHNFQKVCLCRRSSIVALFRKLEGPRGDFKSRHVYTFTYLQTWRLKLSHTKTVSAVFHLNNREAKHELKVCNNNKLLPFCPTPTYLR